MLHVNFQLLVDFIEKEKPDQIINWNSDRYHKKAWKEISELYQWWTVDRKNRKDPLDKKGLKRPKRKFVKVSDEYSMLEDYDHVKYAEYDKAMKESFNLDRQWEEEDQKQLHRLIDVRQYLWT